MNEKKYIIQSTLYSTAQLLITGSVIQSFLLENGIPQEKVTMYLSVVQALQVVVMLVVSLVIDRIKNIIRTMSVTVFLQLLMFLPLIYFSVFSGYTVSFKYLVIFIFGIAVNIVQAVYNVVCYKAPFHIIDMSRYAGVTGKSGVVFGVSGIVLSAVMSYFTVRYDYKPTMLLFFVFGAALIIISFCLALSYKPIHFVSERTEKRKNLFKYKPFLFLIIPNILRGFSTGILAVSVTLGYSAGMADKSSGAILALLLQISTVIGCFIFTYIARNNNEGKIIVYSSVLLAVTMPFMLVGNSVLTFYVMYFLANFFINFINYAVPVAIARIVDYDYIGQYSCWRMLLHTLGISVSNALVTPMYNYLGGVTTFIIAGLCQVLSGAAYFIFLKSIKKSSAV